MAGLDFSKLERIAYPGSATEAQRAQHDALIEQGFKIVESTENPFLQASPGQDQQPPRAPAAAPSKTKLKPLRSLGGRDYRVMYRAACNFHERHVPAQLNEEYWKAACEDMTATSRQFDDDPFLMGLLIAVYEEMEREYQQLQQAASRARAAD